ncbi:MAG: hypothetical protein ABIP53_03275 [Candidatus Limnocylindrales bacterium]
MADPLTSIMRPNQGPQLPAFERFAPVPAENVIAAEIAARTVPGDVVIDLHGRGGWVTRNAIGALRRVYSCESTALTRLLAELVMRPPDLRHFDAGISTLATHPKGEVELRRALELPFMSRCPTCGRPIVVDEFIWESDSADPKAPTQRVFRCSFCKSQTKGVEQRIEPVDEQDIEHAHAMEARPLAWATLRQRFPDSAGSGGASSKGNSLADELLGLYTPRTLTAIETIVTRLETDLKAAPVDAGMRLGLVHALLPLSRLNAYPGRVGSLRIRHGRVQKPAAGAWRERNPWLAFEDGCREVRTFIARVEHGAGTFQPRPGEDMETLIEGTANVVLRTGPASTPGNEPRFSSKRPILPGRLDPRSRVRLVLTQPPIRWSTENVSFAYLATSIVLGKDAAASLPIEWITGAPPRNDRGREATALRRSLLAVRPVLARDASAVVMLDRGGASGLVAGVLGGVGAGFRLNSALLAESGNQLTGMLEFNLGPASTDAEAAASNGHANLDALRPADPDKPFALADVEEAVTSVAVSVLQARGEPASAERLLGEVLIGLDRLGHLRRLVATQTFSETEAAGAEADGEAAGVPASDTEPGGEASAGLENSDDESNDAATDSDADTPDWALGSSSATDHVRLLMEIVMGELRRPDHKRLTEVDPGRWWLRADRDLANARPPLSDRLEWAVFGLLSTSQGIDEGVFFERVARMFTGHDTPDPELVRAVLESYRDPDSALVSLRPRDNLSGRHSEHGEIVGLLTEYGHRLGLRVHVSPKERRREFRGGTVGDLLSEDEVRAYVPLIAAGDVQILESIDCIWYLRGKATFLFEVEWTAMLTDALLRRGARIPSDDTIVRFLVIPPERVELVRSKLARSPLLRRALDDQNWHILKSDHLRRLHARDESGFDQMAPLLGLDPEIEREAEQLPLFG